jgi:hypothetical protein
MYSRGNAGMSFNSNRTVIMFSQGGNNKRIGNTLVWLESAFEWCCKNDFEFYFPMAKEIFGDLLDYNRGIFAEINNHDSNVEEEKSSIGFLNGLGAKMRSHLQEFEEGFYCSNIVNGRVLYIDFRGRSWAPSDELLNFMRQFSLIIVNEPFPFLTDVRTSKAGLSISQNSKDYLLATRTAKPKLAIHIRQGDYRNWQNGIHYRDSGFYNELLDGLLNEFDSFNIVYCHNGEFTPWGGNKALTNPHFDDVLSSANADFITLASSEIVIGPVSTFTGQARKFGKRFALGEPNLYVIEPGESVEALIERVKKNYSLNINV